MISKRALAGFCVGAALTFVGLSTGYQPLFLTAFIVKSVAILLLLKDKRDEATS